MKRFSYRYFIVMLLFLASCGGPDALVINNVYRDGSVDRKIILTFNEDKFDLEACQVPVDSTWTITRKFDVSEKGDTTWTLTAEKHFDSVDMINMDYKTHPGVNKRMVRYADFKKSFRWFTTTYSYREVVEGAIDGYPPSEYFTPGETDLFYMPESMIGELLSGSDSTTVKARVDSLELKKEDWLGASLVRSFVSEVAAFSKQGLFEEIDTSLILKNEKGLMMLLEEMEGDDYGIIDSLLGEGFYSDHHAIIDTAIAVVEEKLDVAFDADSYLVQFVMPGKLTETNGYIDSDSNILFEVDGDSMLAADFVMWARSEEVNEWAWIISFLFVLFVFLGLIRRRRRNR